MQNDIQDPAICESCGQVRALSEFRHAPDCDCDGNDLCSNCICPECYEQRAKEQV